MPNSVSRQWIRWAALLGAAALPGCTSNIALPDGTTLVVSSEWWYLLRSVFAWCLLAVGGVATLVGLIGLLYINETETSWEKTWIFFGPREKVTRSTERSEQWIWLIIGLPILMVGWAIYPSSRDDAIAEATAAASHRVQKKRAARESSERARKSSERGRSEAAATKAQELRSLEDSVQARIRGFQEELDSLRTALRAGLARIPVDSHEALLRESTPVALDLRLKLKEAAEVHSMVKLLKERLKRTRMARVTLEHQARSWARRAEFSDVAGPEEEEELQKQLDRASELLRQSTPAVDRHRLAEAERSLFAELRSR